LEEFDSQVSWELCGVYRIASKYQQLGLGTVPRSLRWMTQLRGWAAIGRDWQLSWRLPPNSIGGCHWPVVPPC